MSLINRCIGVYKAEGFGGLVHRVRKRLTATPSPHIRELSSEYLNWLMFANAGMLTPGNLWCMDYAIKNLPSTAPILEIGSFCGLSANVITHLKEKHKMKTHAGHL